MRKRFADAKTRRYFTNPKYLYGFSEYEVSGARVHGTSILGALAPISVR